MVHQIGCKCGLDLANQSDSASIAAVDEDLTFITAKRVLERVLLMNDLQPVFKKERDWPTLKSLKKTGLPTWWSYKHDVALLESVRECGFDFKNLCKGEVFQDVSTKFPREGLIQQRLQDIARWFKKLSRVSRTHFSRGTLKTTARISARSKQLRIDNFTKPTKSATQRVTSIKGEEEEEEDNDDVRNDNLLVGEGSGEGEFHTSDDSPNQLQRRQRRRRRKPKHFDEINDEEGIENRDDIQNEDDDEDYYDGGEGGGGGGGAFDEEDDGEDEREAKVSTSPPSSPVRKRKRSAPKSAPLVEEGFWVEDAENEIANSAQHADMHDDDAVDEEVSPDEFDAIIDHEVDVAAQEEEEKHRKRVSEAKFVTPSSRKPSTSSSNSKKGKTKQSPKKSPKKSRKKSASTTNSQHNNILQFFVKTSRESLAPLKRPREESDDDAGDAATIPQDQPTKRIKHEAEQVESSAISDAPGFRIAALGSQPTPDLPSTT